MLLWDSIQLPWQRLCPYPNLYGELMAYRKSTMSLALAFTIPFPLGTPTTGTGCRVIRGRQGRQNWLVDLKIIVLSQRALQALFQNEPAIRSGYVLLWLSWQHPARPLCDMVWWSWPHFPLHAPGLDVWPRTRAISIVSLWPQRWFTHEHVTIQAKDS